MKYIITESQFSFIRRYRIIDNLVIRGLEIAQEDEDICDYSFNDFLEEVIWQVLDQTEEHQWDDINSLHSLIEEHFYNTIKDYYYNEIKPRCE